MAPPRVRRPGNDRYAGGTATRTPGWGSWGPGVNTSGSGTRSSRHLGAWKFLFMFSAQRIRKDGGVASRSRSLDPHAAVFFFFFLVFF